MTNESKILAPLVPGEFWPAADRPTIYFIGVTTHQSTIMQMFPAWAEYLGIGDATVRGMNFPPNDRPEHYRRAVEFIRDDPLAQGALVTTHKLNVLRASRDLFDELDEFATLMHEVSSIAKRDGKLLGHAKDAITSGLSLNSIIGNGYWTNSRADLM
ncbi:MAG: hypothetical protein KDB23_31145, partial [Planctomycetales bacterium]|nr:hypothetical protein [Planctomycetales bacterium]